MIIFDMLWTKNYCGHFHLKKCRIYLYINRIKWTFLSTTLYGSYVWSRSRNGQNVHW